MRCQSIGPTSLVLNFRWLGAFSPGLVQAEGRLAPRVRQLGRRTGGRNCSTSYYNSHRSPKNDCQQLKFEINSIAFLTKQHNRILKGLHTVDVSMCLCWKQLNMQELIKAPGLWNQASTSMPWSRWVGLWSLLGLGCLRFLTLWRRIECMKYHE